MSVSLGRSGLLLLCFVFSACSPTDPQPVLGSVFQITGAVTARGRTKQSSPGSLSVGDKFSPGDEIQFQTESSGVLCLTPGIYLRCLGETQVRIETLSVEKDGDETGDAMHLRRASLDLREGRLHAFLPTAATSRAELTIQSRAGTLVANQGSLFSVKLDGESIHIVCLRGEVRWTGIAASVATAIPAGFYAERKLGEQTEAVPRPASEVAIAQLEVLEVLDSARTITELEERARNAPKPWRKP